MNDRASTRRRAPPAARPGAVAMRPVKRSFSIAGHKTSISLEAPFWDCLREVAAGESVSMAELVRRIDSTRDGANLSSAVRVWLLAYYKAQARAPSAAER